MIQQQQQKESHRIKGDNIRNENDAHKKKFIIIMI